MVGGKKWLVVLTEEQHNWIKGVAMETRLKGSDIVRELVERVMSDNPRQFRNSLANTQLKIELQKLNDQEAAIRDRKAELQKQFKGEKVPA